MSEIIRKYAVVLVVCAFLFPGFTGVAMAQPSGDRVFVFGDSLSDPGNIYALTGETAKAPYLPIPSAPYAIGGHHFSNGKTWAEKVAQGLNDHNGGKPAREKPGLYGNYAHGGARARTVNGATVPSSVGQVDLFLGDLGNAPGNALYVLQFGGNDLRDALVAGMSDPAAVEPIMTAAIQELAFAVQKLYLAGARKFLVANAPNIEHAPVVRFSGAGPIAGYLTGVFNGNLEGTLQMLEIGLPGISIQRLDFAGFVNDVVATPSEFGIANAIAPCLTFLVETDAKCSDPDAHFFWDGLHPTGVGHKALAERALAVIAGH
jgi:phospholipase/lecithinase/hemolysin